jgi:hypothetical protein
MIQKLFYSLLILFLVIVNVIVSTVIGNLVLLELVNCGVERHLALGAAFFTVISLYSYLLFGSKIREHAYLKIKEFE